jgi:tetratricopeptide (TPR) repeat protein
MGRPSRSRAEKKKRREKELRRKRNAQRNDPGHPRELEEIGFDMEDALDALPDEVQLERLARRLARVTGITRFASFEDAQAILDTVDDATLAAEHPGDARETAMALAFLAADPANADLALELSEGALEVDPECPDAVAVHAIHSETDFDAQILGVERAIALAKRDLDELDPAGAEAEDAWAHVFARPYMRTRRMLANVLTSCGRGDEAVPHLDAILAMDASDPLQARPSLLGALLAVGDLDRSRKLMQALTEDDPVLVAWALPLERCLAGDLAGAAHALDFARETDALVEQRILQQVHLSDIHPELEEDLDLDPYAEEVDLDRLRNAAVIGLVLGNAWREHPAAFDWLENAGSEERGSGSMSAGSGA